MAASSQHKATAREGEPTPVPEGWLRAARSLLSRADAARSGTWVDVAQRGSTINVEQWWHVMHAWTSGRSFMRSVWRVDVEVGFDELDGRRDDTGEDSAAGACNPHQRWALRRLQRKTPVVCHDDAHTLTLDMLEYAMHEVSVDAEHGTHRCVFGVVLPPSIGSTSGYFPHTYPRSWMYAFSFRPPDHPGSEATLGFSALPLDFQSIQDAAIALSNAPPSRIAKPATLNVGERSGDDVARAIPKEHLQKGVLKVLTMAHKWGAKHVPTLIATGSTPVLAPEPWEVWRVAQQGAAPQRRVPFDVLVPEAMYRRCYNRLKELYGKPWVEKWPEQTDPQKFVYEEVGIAAYLLCLWQLEREADPAKWQADLPSERPRRQTFVDVGCGNGFLTYILIMEGHHGWGVDIFSRGLWRYYPEHVQQCLEVCTMRPGSWVAKSLHPEDPPIPPDAEQLREEEASRARAAEAAAAPVVTEQDTVALFSEMGMGYYDDDNDDDEVDDPEERKQQEPGTECEEASPEVPLHTAVTSPILVAGRRPAAAAPPSVGDNSSVPAGMSSMTPQTDAGAPSFLQPADGLVKECQPPDSWQPPQQLPHLPEPEPDQTDKHGFVSSDGRGRGCANIGSDVAVDWILGNHADELTPWIPLMTARTGRDTRFWILPCCFWGFTAKFEYNDTRLGQYKTYLNFVEAIAQRLGFKCDLEALRIPSTKNLCFVSRPRPELSCLSHNEQSEEADAIADAVEWLLQRKPNHPVHHGLLLEQH